MHEQPAIIVDYLGFRCSEGNRKDNRLRERSIEPSNRLPKTLASLILPI